VGGRGWVRGGRLVVVRAWSAVAGWGGVWVLGASASFELYLTGPLVTISGLVRIALHGLGLRRGNRKSKPPMRSRAHSCGPGLIRERRQADRRDSSMREKGSRACVSPARRSRLGMIVRTDQVW